MSKPTKRCSSLGRDLNCPGAATITARVDARKGEEGTEGTFLHHAAHSRMKKELGAFGDLGPVPPTPSSVKFSQWIADFYFRTVQEMVDPAWSLECEVPLAFEFERFILSGHIDSLAMSPDGTQATFFDLKTGYDPVDIAEESEQCFGYASLLLRAYPDLQKVTAYIVQPRNDEDEGYQRVSPPLVLEGDRIKAALPTFEARINASLDKPMLLRTGKWCKWCVGCSCPAIRAEAKLMEMQMTEEQLAAIQRTPDDAMLGDFAVVAHTLAKPIEDMKAMLKERIAAQGSVVAGSGVTITEKVQKGAYKVERPEEMLATVEEMLDKPRIARAVNWSMTRLKEEIAEQFQCKKTGKGPITAESIFDSRIRTHVSQGERRLLQYN